MGCDIHGWVEITNIYKNSPEFIDAIIELPYRRNYAWFATLAGVRNSFNLKVLSEPKGLPDKMSIMAELLRAEWKDDGHSYSYLTYKELRGIDWLQLVPYADGPMQLTKAVGPTWFGLWLMLGYLASVYGEDNVRMVFWFDN